MVVKNPIWHKMNITVFLSASILVVAFILAVLLNKCVFIAQLMPLQCDKVIERKVIGINLLILFILCLLARVILHVETKRRLGIVRSDGMMTVSAELDHQYDRMELEATKNLIAGLVSLFILTIPSILYFFVTTGISHVPKCERCSYFTWLVPYLRQCGQIHAIYQPITCLLWNQEIVGIWAQ